MLGVEVETVKAVAVAVLVVLGVVAVVAVKVIVSGTVRVLAVAVLAGLGVAVWTQRQALSDCADDARAAAHLAVDGSDVAVTCTFFGREVTVERPEP